MKWVDSSRLRFSLLILLGLLNPALSQDSSADFYRGKTLQVINPFAEAGLYAFLAQLIAEKLPQHLPGRPQGRHVSMPGGGGLQGANYLYNAAPRDGTVIGLLYDNMPTEQALELNKLVKFDARRFTILGSLNKRETGLVGILKRAGVSSIEKAKSKTVVLAATGTASAQYIVPNAMNKLLGTKFKIIPGYKVITDSFLAMETGEADGLFTNYATLTQARPDWISQDRFSFIAQSSDIRDPQFPTVPLLQELTDDPIQRDAFRFLAMSRVAGKIVVAPPGIPPDRASALQEAFRKMLQDPQLLEGMAKLSQEIDPRDAQQVLEVLRATIETDKAALARVRDIMQAE
jgi:tripartite-type tricarboxylate transporter receptor subunit TctC